ncbi:Uncharacterised protein [Mycobacteroides abscessus]|nr:Uncharacterised protein [Mycobacteroides abscessus]SKW13298.1 Uncharacterised protein [Mycobacteroides abscessus subsp. abscessus]
MAVLTGASRGRCSRLWWASSPVSFFSRKGYAISRPNTKPIPTATHTAWGMVWPNG